jgi:hypothetical protein
MSAIFSDLKGRMVFITGGAAGIGAAMVEAFAAQGARSGIEKPIQKWAESVSCYPKCHPEQFPAELIYPENPLTYW